MNSEDVAAALQAARAQLAATDRANSLVFGMPVALLHEDSLAEGDEDAETDSTLSDPEECGVEVQCCRVAVGQGKGGRLTFCECTGCCDW